MRAERRGMTASLYPPRRRLPGSEHVRSDWHVRQRMRQRHCIVVDLTSAGCSPYTTR